MLHYPSQMQRLGPLLQSWTMRQEAKLSFLKRVSCQSNYKNICKTVAKKHQLWMCYQLLKDQHVLTPSVMSSPRVKSSTLQNEDECMKMEFVRLIPNISLNSEIEWINVQSSVLRKGVFVMLEYSVETPVFGLRVDILCFKMTIVLYVQRYVGEFFIPTLKSHGAFAVVNLWSLQDYRPVII